MRGWWGSKRETLKWYLRRFPLQRSRIPSLSFFEEDESLSEKERVKERENLGRVQHLLDQLVQEVEREGTSQRFSDSALFDECKRVFGPDFAHLVNSMFSWEPRERPTEDELLACLSTSTPRELSPLKQKPGRTASREELVATKKRRRDESASALASQASDQSRSMTAFDMSDQDSATMQRMEGGDGAQAALFSLKRTKRLSAFGQEGGPKHYEYPPSVGRRNCDVVLPNAELKVDFSPDGLPEKISFVIDRMRAPYLGSRAKKDDRLSLCFLAAGCSSDEVGAAHKRLAEIVDRIDQFKGKGWPKATEDNPLYIKSAKEEENGEPFWTVKG